MRLDVYNACVFYKRSLLLQDLDVLQETFKPTGALLSMLPEIDLGHSMNLTCPKHRGTGTS